MDSKYFSAMVGTKMILAISLILQAGLSVAQEEHEQEWEQAASNLEAGTSLEWDYPGQQRFNINSITEDQLTSLQLLHPLQIKNFLWYRKTYGDFISLMELQAIPSWDIQTVHHLLPYFKLNTALPLAPELEQGFKEGTHRLLYRIASKWNTDSSRFIETSQLLNHRFQFRDLMQMGFTLEKDAGEKKIPDHASFYASIGNKGIIKKLMLGDFTVNMGQGLIHWQGYALGQSSNLVTGYRQGALFKPHTGTDENRFHRGLAISLQKNNWEFSGFVSSQKIDARLQSDSTEKLIWASSLQTSGLHRTAGELAGRKSLRWQSLGGRIRYLHQQHTSTLNFIYHDFGQPLIKESTPYNLHSMRGRVFPLLSFDHSFFSKWGFFFAESAVKPMESVAIIGGWMKSLDARFDLSLSGRMIRKNFAAFQSNSLTSSGESKDEKGVFVNFNFHPNPQHQLDGYWDQYQKIAPGFSIDGIQYGKTVSLQYKWIPQKKLEFYVRWTQGMKNQNERTAESKSNRLPFAEKDQWRSHFSCKPNMLWMIRIRNEWSRLKIPSKKTETGYLHYAEIIYAPPLKKISFSLRLSSFETGSYATRIYAYERDVLGYFSVPAHDGKGSRYYALVQYKLKKGHILAGKIMLDQRKGESQMNWRFQWIWEP